MQNQMLLRQEAINAAKNSDWPKAILINQEIIQYYGNDLEAMNRLGLAFLKNKQEDEARKTFKNVLELDKSNIIANKHLEKIKNKEASADIIFDQNNDFIEEPISLETPVGDSDDASIKDLIENENESSPADIVAGSNLKERVREILKTLTPREEKVLKMRFGIDVASEHTLEEVGKDFGVTRERIRQIEVKALKKLRHPIRSNVLQSFLEQEYEFKPEDIQEDEEDKE
jgi:RNA polymerase sigma factor (sigma-70 family)